MAKPDPYIAAHLEWIGFVRPTGLVVSAPALVKAGAILNRRDTKGQELLRECAVNGDHGDEEDSSNPWLPDFRDFAETVLEWSLSARAYSGTDEAPIPPELEVVLPDSGGVLRPDFAVRRERLATGRRRNPLEIRDEANDEESPWQLLVCCRDRGEDFDKVAAGSGANSAAEMSPHGSMERLLRQTGVPAGLLFNGVVLRLISAPKGENSGWLDFRVADMLQTAGRPISTAMRQLLGQHRLLIAPRESRLAALLEDSRKYQNEVSERLSEQVLHALYELLRGFQAAHDASKGTLLVQPLKDAPDEVYRGLLTVVLRLVFLLYAEERDMLPQEETFVRSYSLASLYERLREDAALHPDTMDQRYGAYAQLLVLTRMVHDGARSGRMSLPPRHGALFDPDRYRFLEGRGAQIGGARQVSERIEPPLVSDGTIYRVLEKLVVLDGERISYRALDVEHVGSVYETMMGFRLETAIGRSVAVKAAKKGGAPATLDIEALLREAPNKRARWLQDRTDRKLTDRVKRAVVDAFAPDAMLAALDSVIDKDATPDIVPAGAMVLQPSEERRRSGSHYTPRELTEPIVRET
ncbi:MAG: class I SAM-dependent DNA methyltransferase, partial [Gammaproteobacteria bacterium]|nr:class I SAM-dependent DNA methyltransferase [Gammaproteobacteria bacterium]